MPTEKNALPTEEVNNPDFQFVLKALLAAYEPILKEQLDLATKIAATSSYWSRLWPPLSSLT